MRRRTPQNERVARLRSHYRHNRPTGRDIRWAVLDCMHAGLSDRAAADILGLDAEMVRIERDFIYQDSR